MVLQVIKILQFGTVSLHYTAKIVGSELATNEDSNILTSKDSIASQTSECGRKCHLNIELISMKSKLI